MHQFLSLIHILTPTVLLSTAKPLYGKPGKGKPIPIQSVAPDSGSVTIWGEVFSLDKRETRDKKRNIYSIQITDYTSSMILKIIEMKEQSKMLDTIDVYKRQILSPTFPVGKFRR